MKDEDFFLSNSVSKMFSEFYNRENTLGYILAFPFYLIFLVVGYPCAVIADIIMFIIYPYSDKSRGKWQLGLLLAMGVFMIFWKWIITTQYNPLGYMAGGRRK